MDDAGVTNSASLYASGLPVAQEMPEAVTAVPPVVSRRTSTTIATSPASHQIADAPLTGDAMDSGFKFVICWTEIPFSHQQAPKELTKDPSLKDIDDIDWTSEDEREIEDILVVQAAAAAKIEVELKRLQGGVPLEWDVRELPSPSRTAAMLLCHNAGRFPEEITAELHLVVATSRRKVKADEENAAAVDHRCCCCEQGTPSLSVELAEGPARFRRRRRREEMELLAGVLRYRLLRAAWSWRKEDAAGRRSVGMGCSRATIAQPHCRHATLPQCRPLSRRDHRRTASRCCYVAAKGMQWQSASSNRRRVREITTTMMELNSDGKAEAQRWSRRVAAAVSSPLTLSVVRQRSSGEDGSQPRRHSLLLDVLHAAAVPVSPLSVLAASTTDSHHHPSPFPFASSGEAEQ
nr:DNA (cytosine-5)-methyltransferase DRM2-like isoform X1 [Ipomoea trifida]